ncbi:uncharacterized protein DC041_0011899 [Schistosoma bovis]|uniref:Uncharacterized protein n=1 Tax=Schistosoma bovis TaxID=6184 RepID=A0A430QC67_SCHBO|nr:uncharacterized protein DC041_0011899 [Schistosoma bovis]
MVTVDFLSTFSRLPKLIVFDLGVNHCFFILYLSSFFSTSAVNVARQLLQALNWSDLFDYTEIYPGSKTAHFKRYVLIGFTFNFF